jgi:hypothetical protein
LGRDPGCEGVRLSGTSPFGFTDDFENEVLRKRPYLQRRWCVDVVLAQIRIQRQSNGRIRFLGSIPELAGDYLRVVTLADAVTIHSAFLDRRFRR